MLNYIKIIQVAFSFEKKAQSLTRNSGRIQLAYLKEKIYRGFLRYGTQKFSIRSTFTIGSTFSLLEVLEVLFKVYNRGKRNEVLKTVQKVPFRYIPDRGGRFALPPPTSIPKRLPQQICFCSKRIKN